MSTTLVEGAALNASDRCDRCGAQAYVRVTMASGFELLFCAHHSKEHADKLKQVLDVSDDLGPSFFEVTAAAAFLAFAEHSLASRVATAFERRPLLGRRYRRETPLELDRRHAETRSAAMTRPQ